MVNLAKTVSFAENLKKYRKKANLTQKQLAEKLNYTEKSVSKWENGNGFPSTEMLLKLAEFFKVSLDDLVFEKGFNNYFLGIDGGGTKTVFKLVDETGFTVNEICKGASNPNDIGMNNTTSLLEEGINEVCSGVPFYKITMFAGLSGGGLSGNNSETLNNFFKKFGFKNFENGSDIENLLTLANCEKCVLVIMGTGFITFAVNGNVKKRISGWGYFFEEGGSGYTLGKAVITAALREYDGSGKKTKLTYYLEEKIKESAAKHLAKFYKGGKKYVASFANLVFKAAAEQDTVALNILEQNMKFAANIIDTAVNEIQSKCKGEVPVLFSGGITTESNLLFPIITKHLKNKNCKLLKIQGEQIDGAVQRAISIYNKH